MSKVMPNATTNPDVRVLVNLCEVQHVVQSQHPRRSLGEVHGRVHMVLHLKERKHESGDNNAKSLYTDGFTIITEVTEICSEDSQ